MGKTIKLIVFSVGWLRGMPVVSPSFKRFLIKVGLAGLVSALLFKDLNQFIMKYDVKEKKVWSGSHDGVGFEIQHWVTPPNIVDDFSRQHWTYYIYLHLDRIPEQYNPESFWLNGRQSGSHVFYDYYEHPVLGSIDFHGGCTWYSKESGFDDSKRVIKVGCDYQHYWDEGVPYRFEDILQDAINTIKDFKLKVNRYMYWCCGNGKLYYKEDGVMKGESFCSKEYWGDKDWFKELAVKSEINSL